MICQAQVTNDIDEIINDESINSTQKAKLVNTRVGQGNSEKNLIGHPC